MANDPRWIDVEAAERHLAQAVHSLPDEAVVAWGWWPNAPGPDVISVNIKTGQVTLWDAKTSGSTRTLTPSQFQLDQRTKDSWIDTAREQIDASSTLSGRIKNKATAALREGDVRFHAAAFGNLKNSRIEPTP